MRWWHGTRHLLLCQLGVHNPKQRALAASWHPAPDCTAVGLLNWVGWMEGWWSRRVWGWVLTWAPLGLFVPSVIDVGAIVDPKLLKTPRGSGQDKFFLWFINLLLLTDICIVYPVTE